MVGPPRVRFHMDGSGRVRQDTDVDATAWTVVGAAIAILVAIGTSSRSLRGEMRDQRKGLADLRERIDAQGEQMGLLRERMAHLEGLLDGLREAITNRAA